MTSDEAKQLAKGQVVWCSRYRKDGEQAKVQRTLETSAYINGVCIVLDFADGTEAGLDAQFVHLEQPR